MARKITDNERVETFFISESQANCVLMRDKIDLVMRTRFQDLAPAKRGRPRKAKGKPPIVAPEVGA